MDHPLIEVACRGGPGAAGTDAAAVAMPGVLWLAAYPKSGSTWLTVLRLQSLSTMWSYSAV